MNRRRFIPGIFAAALVLILGGLVGCTIEPWVKPYDREHLADPIMSIPRDPIADKDRQHVFDTHEAARGAVTSEGGGCGCK